MQPPRLCSFCSSPLSTLLVKGFPNNISPQVQEPCASLVAETVKNPLARQETRVQSWSREDPLERGMAIHSSILAWGIPRTEEPGELQPMEKRRVRHDLTTRQEPRCTLLVVWKRACGFLAWSPSCLTPTSMSEATHLLLGLQSVLLPWLQVHMTWELQNLPLAATPPQDPALIGLGHAGCGRVQRVPRGREGPRAQPLLYPSASSPRSAYDFLLTPATYFLVRAALSPSLPHVLVPVNTQL